ncbi:hypothetical protein GX50_00581 [[Emmonsia] crescens]|uniref:Uncharacterized protein n=1 Tax=[Emmonsia] crescens TaxID=73230 RepID=A0A2B7ZSB1_9EURO|nr:hypothetical protein GX50_00581 [Emmonsia crescens]
MVHQFWNRVLGKLGCGKDGCKLRGIKKTSSLNSDWKFFQHYYEKVTGSLVSQGMDECVRRGMRFLADKFEPDDQVRDNIPVYIKDMVPFNQTIFQTRETQLHPGLQRLLLCFYSMLGLFTVNRENAILNLWYKGLRLSVQRDSHGGPSVPTVDFRLEFIKSTYGVEKNSTSLYSWRLSTTSRLFSVHMSSSLAFCFTPMHSKTLASGQWKMSGNFSLWRGDRRWSYH